MAIKAEGSTFKKNGQPYFLISGEIQYFRLSPDKWEKHIALLKESGANTVSTYIPWDWHEYEEGCFDFTGKTHPAKNLIGYIEMCKKAGIDLIVKPGPYVLAEYELQGLPGWLCKRCSEEAFAVDGDGKVISVDLMTYMSDEFLKYVFRWYDKIMPVIAKNQHENGGPVVMMQVCNEVGVFQWLSGRIDYNRSVLALYKNYITERYGNAESLNAVYGTDYKSLDEVCPPKGNIENRKDYAAYFDFHLFYRYYFALYIDTLVKKIRSYGISVQLTHNIPGWIYGNASELPMLLSTYVDIIRGSDDIVFGLDHIPEFVSYRNAHSDLACNKILEAVQKGKPVWAAEFQAGSREHHVKNYARDMELFYLASLAHGIKGFNFYMFSQGKNPRDKGYYGDMFYYWTALDCNAEKHPLYDTIEKTAGFINQEKDSLPESETKAEVCVGLYLPYFYTELIASQMLKKERLDIERLGLYLNPRFVREEVLFNGLLRALQTLNYSYDVKDLETSDVDTLLKYRQLWVTTTEFMDEKTQGLLVSYIRAGGSLIIYPAIPCMDNYLNHCTKLKDGLGLDFNVEISPCKVEAFGIENIYTCFESKQIFRVDGTDNAKAVSHTKTGGICGIRKKAGKGTVTALGYAIGYTCEEHLKLYERILSLDGAKRDMDVSDPDIQFVVRRGKGCDYLFFMNYHNEDKEFTVDSSFKEVIKPFSCKVIMRRA